MRILVMEDDPGLAQLIQRRLEGVGYAVDLAHDGTEGLAMAAAGSYDLVTVDQSMPGLDGLEVIRRLAERRPPPPLVMITGKGNEQTAVEAMKQGARDYIVKDTGGLFLARLPSVIERVLHEKRLAEGKELAENALRDLSSRYKAILAAIPDIIMEVDGNKVYTWANPAGVAFFGDDALGKEAAYYFEGEQQTYQTVRPLFEGDENVIYVESWQRRKDGQKRLLAWWCRVLKDADGNVTGAISTARDLTEQRRAEEERRKLETQMQQAQKLESLGVLAGGIAHDFNNLLTGILGYAELALHDLSPASPACDSIREIIRTTTHAAELSRQMLAYSGKGRFVIGPLNLNEVVREMSHLLKVSLSKKAVLNLRLADNLPAVEADATQVRQVIMNLITNASEALGDRSGFISISTGAMSCDRPYLAKTWLDEQLPEGVYVYLEVSDTGCGMDEETQKKIFDPFFTTKFQGRGLGLAAALGIVRGHKGAIRLYSEPGRGTTFKILLPALDQPAAGLAKEPSEVERWRGSGTILVVDDEDTVRTVGRLLLQKAGFSVLTASDGREALERFRDHKSAIVCVLLDLTMPHMDGEETFRELRRIKEDVRVILSSGYNEQEIVGRFVEKGLAGFIQKPYKASTLLAKLKALLEE
jgi:PAS domain S-box-containing protein